MCIRDRYQRRVRGVQPRPRTQQQGVQGHSPPMSFNATAYSQGLDRDRTPSETEAKLLEQQLQVPSQEFVQRGDDILRIEREVTEVAEISQDLAVMIDSQKPLIATTDHNIDATADNTARGNENLRKAVSGRNWKQKICCGILLMLSIFNMICIIIIIKRQSK
eukprot:TRINITY_DN1066_c0_g1_i1.p1 TRINITY_DN1066_c0_g1~~TRINITY_DN1066_c0_g1_i1.p1  ORF type:complete len:163 (+),score=48.43 TRINITY_DN1066_c0_g1_i1:3-491(+)